MNSGDELYTGALTGLNFDPSDQGSAMAEMAKALLAGSDQTTSMPGGSALRIEDLERTLKIQTAQAKHCTFWRDISKIPATSTVVQYTQQSDLGHANSIGETGIPDEDDPTLARKFSTIKYIASTGKVMIPMTRVDAIENPWSVQTAARTIACMIHADRMLFYGDSRAIPTEFDGVFKQLGDAVTAGTVNSENIIDMGGYRFQQEHALSLATEIVVNNYGSANRAYIAPSAKMGYEKELIAEKRLVLGMGQNNPLTVGIDPNRYVTANGEGQILTDVFLKTSIAPTTSRGTRAPAAPTVSCTEGDHTGSNLAQSHYYYAITAVNCWGESAPSYCDAAIDAANKGMNIQMADSGGTYAATAFRVYRKSAVDQDTANFKYAWQIAAADAAPWMDYNQYRAGCTHGLILDFDPDQVLRVRQLINFFALPLARLDMSDRKLFVLACTLLCYNLKRIIWVKNIGDTTWISS